MVNLSSVSICFIESSPDPLTTESRFFLEPASSAQRQYEALGAYFVEAVSSADSHSDRSGQRTVSDAGPPARRI